LENKFLETNLEKKTNSPTSDDSIIDATGQSLTIEHKLYYKKYWKGVPFWQSQFIFSYADLYHTNPDQKKFYYKFKTDFNKGVYLDLQSNENYAFILLFDLVEEYEVNRNITKLENKLLTLAEYYPSTMTYATGLIQKKKDEKKEDVHVSRAYMLKYLKSYEEDEQSKPGNKYKKLLNLNNDEIRLLNKITYEGSSFWKIGYTDVEIIKLFLKTIEILQEKYIEEETLLEIQLTAVANVILKYNTIGKFRGQAYNFTLAATINELYNTILKYCENILRLHYGVSRKISVSHNYTNPVIHGEFESRILSKTKDILIDLVDTIRLPDLAMEIELNAQYLYRWKAHYKEITDKFNYHPAPFFEAITNLGKINRQNPALKFIYYEATKFALKMDSTIALKLYIYFLYYDRLSVQQEKLITVKEIKKTLFKTKDQLSKFENIQAKLNQDRDLEAALESATYFFIPQRKKIQLDKLSINEVVKEHADTVELLGSYLQDEEEIKNEVAKQSIAKKPITKQTVKKETNLKSSHFRIDIPFTELQLSLLELFSKNKFTLTEAKIKSFSNSKGVLKNQLIESMNELCFEIIDDLLIEEEEGKYIINPDNYRLVLAV